MSVLPVIFLLTSLCGKAQTPPWDLAAGSTVVAHSVRDEFASNRFEVFVNSRFPSSAQFVFCEC